MTVLLGVVTRMRLARLLVISDLRQSADDLPSFAEAVLDGGADVLQLRDATAGTAELIAGFARVRQAVRSHKALLGVYDSLPVADAVRPDLVQLAERGPALGDARDHLPRYALVGRSCHSRRAVDAALADPQVDYLMVGPVASRVPAPGERGFDLVRYAAAVAPPSDPTSKPWFAVGGVTEQNLDDVLAAGGRRIAVSTAVAVEDPKAATQSLTARLALAWKADPAMARIVFGAFNPAPSPAPPDASR